MPSQFTRADSLREYLTGASGDGVAQSDPSLSLGNFRSSIEAVSLGIAVYNSIAGVRVLYAGGKNSSGRNAFTAIDSNNLVWQGGEPVTWPDNANLTQIVEASSDPGSYLRVNATAPFTPGQSTVQLSQLYNNIFGFDPVVVADALTGLSNYRATMIRNESSYSVTLFQRCIVQLGTHQVSNSAQLGGSGAGVITTTGSFADWPSVGFCQVRSSIGVLKECVYYSSRTNATLTVPATGRQMLGTTNTAGANTDLVYAVPGVAIGIDPAGVQASGSSIQMIANQTAPPIGVIWNLGITLATGLQVPILNPNTEIGIWVWRQMPAGAIATPSAAVRYTDSFKTIA